MLFPPASLVKMHGQPNGSANIISMDDERLKNLGGGDYWKGKPLFS